jgi:hypothetical protein
MAIIYFNNSSPSAPDRWETRCENMAVIRIIERAGLACNESVMLVPWWRVVA